MKILVAGKGGSGKSTISALLAKELSKNYGVLVVDNDESNFGLHTFLGLDLPEDLMYYFGGKENLFEKADEIQDGIEVENLPDEYLSHRNGLSLLVIGKIKEYGEGCACPMNALSSEFLKAVKLHENELLLADMDAGIEHFGRKVEKGADVVLTVIDPTRESLKLSEKITKFGDEIGKKVFYILNKVNDETKSVMLESLDENRVLGSIPEDKRLAEAGLKGKELDFELKEAEQVANSLGKIIEDSE